MVEVESAMALDLLKSFDVLLLVRLFYLSCSVAIMVARLVPSLQQRYLAYGARAQTQILEHNRQPVLRKTVDLSGWLDRIADLNVPHSWFTHFYLASIASTVFCLIGFVWQCSYTIRPAETTTAKRLQSSQSVVLCLILMLIQGVRRLYECTVLMRSSSSTMWIGHYAFGHAFYLVTNVAIWVESSCVWQIQQQPSQAFPIADWSASAWVGVSLFLIASIAQHLAHRQLANLKKYSVPSGLLFNSMIAPHYTAECLIYLGLAMAAAPPSQILNRTLGCTVLLTTINLGITAEGTKRWMLDKFREQREEIVNRYCLLPGVW